MNYSNMNPENEENVKINHKKIEPNSPEWDRLVEGVKKIKKAIMNDKNYTEGVTHDAWEEYDEDNVEVRVGEYKQHIQYYDNTNKPIMAIFFNWFNKLNYKRQYENTPTINDVTIIGILDDDANFIASFPDYPPVTFTYSVMLDYKGILLSFVMQAYRENSQIRNIIRITSRDTTVEKSRIVYNDLFKLAIHESTLKGSYMTIEDEELLWEVRDLKDITYDDVYLPEILTEDVSLYTKLYEKKGILQRYMFSGAPGTAKTESTRAISNILNKQGVTVIKTNICKIIKEKFELAKILAPSVIILDDIDLYLGDRNSSGVSPLLGMFLDILDGVDKLPDNVGVLASTNAPHLIDLAASRPGRFNKVLFFDELTYENIENIIKKSLKAMNEKHNNLIEEDIEKLTDSRLITFFRDKRLTGAYIFEAVQDIKNKAETLDREIDIEKSISELSQRNDTLDKKLESMKIESKLKKVGSKIGY
jgi:AAA+ superfamily predicted ATPase